MPHLLHRHRSPGTAARLASVEHERLQRREHRLAAAAAVLREHRHEAPTPGVSSALERFEAQLRQVRRQLGSHH